MVETGALRTDPSNADQAAAWDGDEGAYWAAHAARFEDSLARYHRPFFDTAAIDAASRVLDVGCGTGGTTREAARRASSGTALGVDLSARMVDVARVAAEREGIGNARFEQADAQIHPFAGEAFDVAISRTGTMFFGDPVAAFTNISRALRPGGRLAMLVWQELAANEWVAEFSTAMAAGRERPAPPPDAPGPFSMSDPDRVRRLLSSAGFTEPSVDGVSEAMYFGPDADDAYEFVLGVTGWMLDGLEDDGVSGALDALRATMRSHETDEGVWFGSAAWLVTAERIG